MLVCLKFYENPLVRSVEAAISPLLSRGFEGQPHSEVGGTL